MKWYVRIFCFFVGFIITAASLALMFSNADSAMNWIRTTFGDETFLFYFISIALLTLFGSMSMFGLLLIEVAFSGDNNKDDKKAIEKKKYEYYTDLSNPLNPMSPLNPTNPANPASPIHHPFK